MNGASAYETEYSEFVEVDPTGRYGRYNEILGTGASKTVAVVNKSRGTTLTSGLQLTRGKSYAYESIKKNQLESSCESGHPAPITTGLTTAPLGLNMKIYRGCTVKFISSRP
ncbi:hypothetical protein CsSME_00020918 [Camellia sinensis var. sinensis]